MSEQDDAPGGIHRHLTHLQSIIAIVTGLITIGGATYSVVRFFNPPSDQGQIVAVVLEAASGKAVPDATVEIRTPQKALVATLKLDSAGRVRYALKEGTYDVRVRHEKYGATTNEILVTPGHEVELTVQLSPAFSPVKGLSHAVRKILRQ